MVRHTVTTRHSESWFVFVRRFIGQMTDHIFTGAELNELTDEEFQKVFKQYSVYARVSPEHKGSYRESLAKEGKVVAMTGWGQQMHHHLRQRYRYWYGDYWCRRFLKRELLIWSC